MMNSVGTLNISKFIESTQLTRTKVFALANRPIPIRMGRAKLLIGTKLSGWNYKYLYITLSVNDNMRYKPTMIISNGSICHLTFFLGVAG